MLNVCEERLHHHLVNLVLLTLTLDQHRRRALVLVASGPQTNVDTVIVSARPKFDVIPFTFKELSGQPLELAPIHVANQIDILRKIVNVTLVEKSAVLRIERLAREKVLQVSRVFPVPLSERRPRVDVDEQFNRLDVCSK